MSPDIKRIVLKFILFLPILGLFVGINFGVDPAHLFHNAGYIGGMAKILLEGKNVADISNYDAGLLQQYYINGLARRKDVLLLGSSRSMQIRASLFAPRSFFNSSVESATLLDLAAVYQIYYEKDLLPSTVILGLDYPMFSVNWPETYASLENASTAVSKRMGEPVHPTARERIQIGADKYSQLVSPAYFHDALRALPDVLHRRGYYGTFESSGEELTKLSDGSLVYGRVMRNRSSSQMRRDVISHSEDDINRHNVFDPNAAKRLSDLIDLLQRDGVRVVLLLPPYHPYAYDYWAGEGRLGLVGRVQQTVRDVALEKHVVLLGSFNPSDEGCDESEFFDEVHPKESCVNKIMARSDLVPRR